MGDSKKAKLNDNVEEGRRDSVRSDNAVETKTSNDQQRRESVKSGSEVGAKISDGKSSTKIKNDDRKGSLSSSNPLQVKSATNENVTSGTDVASTASPASTTISPKVSKGSSVVNKMKCEIKKIDFKNLFKKTDYLKNGIIVVGVIIALIIVVSFLSGKGKSSTKEPPGTTPPSIISINLSQTKYPSFDYKDFTNLVDFKDSKEDYSLVDKHSGTKLRKKRSKVLKKLKN